MKYWKCTARGARPEVVDACIGVMRGEVVVVAAWLGMMREVVVVAAWLGMMREVVVVAAWLGMMREVVVVAGCVAWIH